MRPITLATCRSSLLAFGWFGLILAGCGGSSKGTVSASASTAPPASSAQPASTASAAPWVPDIGAPPGLAPGWPARTDFANPPAGAEKTPSGVASQVVRPGNGTAKPTSYDQVRVHYSGWTADGRLFDSSVERKEPAQFPLNGVIPCWTEGVQKIKVGGKAKLVCPSDLAYGDRGSPPVIGPGATLVFEVELLEIVKQ